MHRSRHRLSSMMLLWWSNKGRLSRVRDSVRASRRASVGATVLLIWTIAAIWGPARAADQMTPYRGRVPIPTLLVMPSAIIVKPHEHILLTAIPHGGEARLFSVKWLLVEGPSGGRLTADNIRHDDGSFSAEYTAPDRGGPYHIKAILREFPSAIAETTVKLEPYIQK